MNEGEGLAEVVKVERRCNIQVKGRGVSQIISEFAAVRSLLSSASPPLTDKKLLARLWLRVPAGAKLLRTEAKRGEMHLYMSLVFFAACSHLSAWLSSYGIYLMNYGTCI
jgi:hypothetical protein